jgi:hypothetical protein
MSKTKKKSIIKFFIMKGSQYIVYKYYIIEETICLKLKKNNE